MASCISSELTGRPCWQNFNCNSNEFFHTSVVAPRSQIHALARRQCLRSQACQNKAQSFETFEVTHPPTQQLSDSKKKNRFKSFNFVEDPPCWMVCCQFHPFAFSAPIAWEVQKRRETATFTWRITALPGKPWIHELSSINLNRIKEAVAFPV